MSASDTGTTSTGQSSISAHNHTRTKLNTNERQDFQPTRFIDITMSDEEGTSAVPSPVVTGHADPSGGRGSYREEETEEVSGSEFSELESSEVEMEVEEEWEGKGHGRPNFRRAASGAWQPQSTQGFFQRGGDNIFDTPGKSVIDNRRVREPS